jgi:DNA-binding response OmpR family regulator
MALNVTFGHLYALRATSNAVVASACSKPTVFILNDENLVVSTLVTMLFQQGYEAVGFTTCATAVQQSATLKPDLALIDIVVGEENGVDAAKEIRKRVPGCQILLMSGRPEAKEVLDRAQAEGQNFEILAKPIPPAELLQIIGRRLRRQAA